MPCHSCGFQGLVITCYLATLVNRGSYVLPLLWLPGPRHYLLFNHVSKSWISMSCHSCGFQDLVITCYLAMLVNRGLPFLPSWQLGLSLCAPFCHVSNAISFFFISL